MDLWNKELHRLMLLRKELWHTHAHFWSPQLILLPTVNNQEQLLTHPWNKITIITRQYLAHLSLQSPQNQILIISLSWWMQRLTELCASALAWTADGVSVHRSACHIFKEMLWRPVYRVLCVFFDVVHASPSCAGKSCLNVRHSRNKCFCTGTHSHTNLQHHWHILVEINVF